MKSINKNYIIFGLTILIVILLVIILLIVLNGKPQFNFTNETGKNQTEEKNNSEESKNNKVDSDIKDNTNVEEENNFSNKNQNKVENNPTNNNASVNSSSNNTDKASSEEELITYFENESNQIDTYNDQDNSTFREKVKTTFINIIDFIFYDKEIKGYTFNELTNSAKLKIIKIALTIDNKIEKYFPNYKTIIKDKYNDIKGKLAVKYLEFTSSLCEQVGEDTCSQAKEDFNNMKDSFGFTWSLIKELATNGKETIKNYYENEFRK